MKSFFAGGLDSTEMNCYDEDKKKQFIYKRFGEIYRKENTR